MSSRKKVQGKKSSFSQHYKSPKFTLKKPPRKPIRKTTPKKPPRKTPRKIPLKFPSTRSGRGDKGKGKGVQKVVKTVKGGGVRKIAKQVRGVIHPSRKQAVKTVVGTSRRVSGKRRVDPIRSLASKVGWSRRRLRENGVDIGEVESGVLFDRRVYGNVFNNAKIYKEIAKLEALTKEGKNRVLHVNLKCKGVGKRKQKKGKKGKVNNWISIPAFKANQANAEEIVKAVEELLQRYATEDSEGDESEPEIEDSEVVVAFL